MNIFEITQLNESFLRILDNLNIDIYKNPPNWLARLMRPGSEWTADDLISLPVDAEYPELAKRVHETGMILKYGTEKQKLAARIDLREINIKVIETLSLKTPQSKVFDKLSRYFGQGYHIRWGSKSSTGPRAQAGNTYAANTYSGTHAYPLDEMWRFISTNPRNVPFARDADGIFVLKPRAGVEIVDISEFTSSTRNVKNAIRDLVKKTNPNWSHSKAKAFAEEHLDRYKGYNGATIIKNFIQDILTAEPPTNRVKYRRHLEKIAYKDADVLIETSKNGYIITKFTNPRAFQTVEFIDLTGVPIPKNFVK